MPIISSVILSHSPENPTTLYPVKERHTDHNGKTYDVDYQCEPTTDPNMVLAMRAERLGAEIDARELAISQAQNFALPVSRLEFLKRFTNTEYATITAARAVNAGLDFYWQKLMASDCVYLADAETVGGVNLLEQAGLIGAGRAAEILGA